ncbi:MAG: polysaccharide deacetylase family protein [Myxococcaceae bacterium]
MIGRPLIALMYHGLGEPADARVGHRYTVTVPAFEEQLDLVRALHVNVVAPEQATQTGGLMLTFDGGESSVAREALPRMAVRGMRGAVFMTTEWIGRSGFLDRQALRELQAAGWLIGSRGHTNRHLNSLHPKELEDELARSKGRLEELFGLPVSHLALPGGRYSKNVLDRARKLGLTTFWTSRPGLSAIPVTDSLVRRTAIRRHESRRRFTRLVTGDRMVHALEELSSNARFTMRRLVGEERYLRLSSAVLGWFAEKPSRHHLRRRTPARP